MAIKAFSRLERVYSSKEVTYGTAVAPTGAQVMRAIKLGLNNDVNLLRRRDKTGSRTGVQGVRGRIAAKWSLEASMVGSGTAGTAPPHDLIYQMLFGNTPTIVASTSATYTETDAIISTDLWSYRRPSGVEQRVAIGSVLQNFEFTLGQDIAEFRCDGEALYMLGSTNYATADTIGKGGLGSYPVEPTPVYSDGGLIAGFTGAITLDSQTLVNFRQCTIKGNTGNALVRDVFGSYYPTSAEGDERQFTFSFNTYDDDSSALGIIKEAADKKTPVGATVQIGTVAGSIATFTLTGIQILSPTYDDSQRSYVVTVGDSPFKGSNTSATDELVLAWT